MRLIDADKIEPYEQLELLSNGHIHIDRMAYMNDIDALPTVDAVPVRHGHWIPCHPLGDDGPEGYMCSVCRVGGWEKTDFCPHCGARMDGDGNETD